LDDDAAVNRQGTAAQSGPRPARQKWNAMIIRKLDDLGNLFGSLRENDNVRFVSKQGQSIALVDQKLRFILNHSGAAENVAQFIDELFVHVYPRPFCRS